jgi:hypothetical protein
MYLPAIRLDNFFLKKINYIHRPFQHVFIVKKIISENKKIYVYICNQINQTPYLLINEQNKQ